jgi:hypothetical protein
MTPTAASCVCAVLLVAGCASSRPPPAATAAGGHSPDWAANAATSEEFQFTPQGEEKAKAADAPVVGLRVDSVSAADVKHTRLNAATR